MTSSEPLSYHGARLLILLRFCGRPAAKESSIVGIKSRTLLAKLDFFVRYPNYLLKAAEILGRKRPLERIVGLPVQPESIESRMVRYRYGPWDHSYYSVLGYLIGKNLIRVQRYQGVDVFTLTVTGESVATQLASLEDFGDIRLLAEAVGDTFGAYNGTRLKNFIYDNFPEIVHMRSGVKI